MFKKFLKENPDIADAIEQAVRTDAGLVSADVMGAHADEDAAALAEAEAAGEALGDTPAKTD